MTLDSPLKSLQVILAGAVATTELDWIVEYVDLLQSTMAQTADSEDDGTSNGATAVAMVAAPATGTSRHIKFLSIQQKDTATATVSVRVNNNGTFRTVWKGALVAGDNLIYTDDVFLVMDSTGSLRTNFSFGDPLQVAHGGTGTATAFPSGSVVLAGASGIYTSDTDLTFLTDTLTATKLLAPTSVSTPSLISTTALTVTPAAGSNLNVTLSTTGDFAVNTNQLYVDTSAGNVGFGTTTPLTMVHVGDTAAATGGDFRLGGSATTNFYTFTTKTSNDLELNVASGIARYFNLLNSGAGKLGLTTTGNIGAGVTPPLVRLHASTPGNNNNTELAYFVDPDIATNGFNTYILIGKAPGDAFVVGHQYNSTIGDSGGFLSVYGDSAGTGMFFRKGGNVAFGTVTLPTALVSIAEKMLLTSAGLVSKYNNITTISNGMPSEYATVDLTAQGAAITATTLYAVPAAGAGMYRISFVAKVTQVATTSSILGGAGGFQLLYTDANDSVVVTTPTEAFDSDNTTLALNTTQAYYAGVLIVNAKASTNIQYQMGYTSVGATPMQYNLHIKVEAL